VIIRDNRIEQFGCHLPLTSNVHPQLRFGLRHTAALGLSERCDALCVVVSEERGTIFLAQSEQLTEVGNAAELRNVLENFYTRNTPARPEHPILVWLKEHPKEKVIALVLAFILWLTFGYQRDSVRRDFTVPIEYVNLAPNWALEGSRNTDAVVTLSGPSQAFQILKPEKLKVSIDLAKIQNGRQEIPLTEGLIETPADLTVVGIKPERITITLSRLISIDAPIEAVIDHPLDGWTLQRTNVMPSSIRILVPDRMRSRRIRLKTEPIKVQPTAESQIYSAKVIIPADVLMEGGKIPEVSVTVKLRKKTSATRIHPLESLKETSEDAQK